MTTIVANSYDIQLARYELAQSLGAIDAKRPDAWKTYGYPTDITFQHMLAAYERGGAAHGAVHRLLDKCWQELPRIKSPASDQETPWEQRVNAVLKSVSAWAKLRDFDRRNMIGRYAALIYRVADGKALRDPLDRAARLADLVPVYEDQLRVTMWDSDTTSESYGQPLMYQYQSRRVQTGDNQGQPIEWADVHPSRVQILAEGSVGDMFDGVPMLRAGFNSLVDLEKISGGSAESYLKNSARTLVFQYDRDTAVQAIGENGERVSVRQAHEEQARALNRNQDSSIVMQGGTASTLQTATHDPKPSFEVAANLFSASVRIPYTVLFGQQTGRLASDEDKADFAARASSRQANELTPMLTEFIRRMQAAGIIEDGEFEVEWPDVAAPSEKEKVELLKSYTTAMREAFGAGVQGLFEADELRAVVDFEPLQNDGISTEGSAPTDA
jgi:hypothetical protein